LLTLLRETALAHGWWLREVQDPDACLRLLGDADPCVLVLEVGRRLPREFALLDRIKACCPGVAVVVVGETDNVAVSNLAWDLGADYVLFPPLPMELLPDVVKGLMRRTDVESVPDSGGTL
jgi:DNA-binding response OmpR family regulator